MRATRKRAEPFYYSPQWRALKRAAHERDRYRCVACGCDVSGPGNARADHIKPRKTHPELALTLSNVRTLCTTCDNQGHREKGRGGHGPRDERFVPRGCDADGRPLDPHHPWAN